MDYVVTPNYALGWKDSFIVGLFHFINKFISWDKLPSYIGALNLEALRVELRQYNLHDGYASGAEQGTKATCPMTNPRFKDARSSDGTFNSTDMPRMGCAGMRFGRNFPRQLTAKPTEAELMTPNPRMLSERFMKRKKFIPATTLNLIAAAWIQFQTHDWFFHEDDYDNLFDIKLPSNDSSWPDKQMKLPKTKEDEVKSESDKKCPGYRNMNTAWWDSSQIYGSDEATTERLRNFHPDGELALDKEHGCEYLPHDKDGNASTGFNDNWWIGMELLHTLFAMEHNAICQMLRKNYPNWGGDEIFDKARLINCALMAKIHTVEWTPGILAHPTLQVAMGANWWGILGEKLYKLLGRVSKTSEAVSGIPGSGIDHQGVPYSLTEEFVSVYRLHTLCPDNIAFFDSKSGKHAATVPVADTLFKGSRSPLSGKLNFADAFYSFGINYPGAIVNHNYPDFLRNLVTPDGIRKDLGTIDILRDRERGVPRYTEFRRLLRMPVPKTFEDITGGDKALAADLSDAYGGKIELVDAIIGSHSEPVPKGFGFSDMAFRIFVLMASRRLKSDRFIAQQWNTQTYTKEGMNWVQTYGMKDVLIRHFPQLAPVLKDQKNVFAPWQKLPQSKAYPGPETNAL